MIFVRRDCVKMVREMNYGNLTTEKINKNTVDIDLCETEEIVRLINAEDKKVAFAVEREIPQIVRAVDLIADSLRSGGRLIYIGAGTSGRLGVLDASECPPTYGTDPDRIVGVIAGGDVALRSAREGAEDDGETGSRELLALNVCARDTVVGISASGSAAYVIEAMRTARSVGAKTVGVCNAQSEPMREVADVFVSVDTGPEAITGSTRMKAGTAQKMVLNIFTTSAMVKIGKTYRNFMVDICPGNVKLKNRAARIVAAAAGIDEECASRYLGLTHGNVKTALVAAVAGVDAAAAETALNENGGVARKAIAAIVASNG